MSPTRARAAHAPASRSGRWPTRSSTSFTAGPGGCGVHPRTSSATGTRNTTDIFAFLTAWFASASTGSMGPIDTISDPIAGNPYGYCGDYFDAETHGSRFYTTHNPLSKISGEPENRTGGRIKRRGGDSNPRYGNTVNRFSRPTRSTTLPPLRRCRGLGTGPNPRHVDRPSLGTSWPQSNRPAAASPHPPPNPIPPQARLAEVHSAP